MHSCVGIEFSRKSLFWTCAQWPVFTCIDNWPWLNSRLFEYKHELGRAHGTLRKSCSIMPRNTVPMGCVQDGDRDNPWWWGVVSAMVELSHPCPSKTFVGKGAWVRGMGEGCGASSMGGFIKCCQQYHLRFRQNQISCGSSLTVSSGDWKSASFSLVVGEGLGRGGWASDGLRDATRNQHVSSRFSMVQLWAKVRISQETQFDFYITSNLDQNLPYKHCIYKPS